MKAIHYFNHASPSQLKNYLQLATKFAQLSSEGIVKLQPTIVIIKFAMFYQLLATILICIIIAEGHHCMPSITPTWSDHCHMLSYPRPSYQTQEWDSPCHQMKSRQEKRYRHISTHQVKMKILVTVISLIRLSKQPVLNLRCVITQLAIIPLITLLLY